MRAARMALTLPLALAALLLAAGNGLSQTGTPEASTEAAPAPLPRVPGITILPPLDGPGSAERRPGQPQAGEGDADAPGCPYRNNKLELIV